MSTVTTETGASWWVSNPQAPLEPAFPLVLAGFTHVALITAFFWAIVS